MQGKAKGCSCRWLSVGPGSSSLHFRVRARWLRPPGSVPLPLSCPVWPWIGAAPPSPPLPGPHQLRAWSDARGSLGCGPGGLMWLLRWWELGLSAVGSPRRQGQVGFPGPGAERTRFPHRKRKGLWGGWRKWVVLRSHLGEQGNAFHLVPCC